MAEISNKLQNMISTSKMPNFKFIMVYTGKGNTIINLDNFSDSATISTKYIETIEKYGKDNVRFCKVVPANIKMEVVFGDG